MSGYWMERDKKVVKAIEEIITRDFSDDDGPVKGAVRDLVSTDLATPGSAARAAVEETRVVPFRPFHTALAKRETTPVDIVCIGDSITEGARSSTLDDRWVNRLRDKLRSAYPTPGVSGGFGYIPAQYYTTGPNNDSQVFTLTGGVVLATTQFGLGKRSVVLDASGEKITASNIQCSSFDVVYTQGTTQGTFGVSIDGGAVTTHSTAGATSSGTRWNAGALTPGEHDIEISWQSGNKVDIEGIMVYDGDEDAGIRMWEGGHGGVKTSAFNISASPVTYWQETITNIQPDLVLIELGTNDWWYNSGVVSGNYGNYGPDQMVTYLDTLIDGIRARCTGPVSIALIVAHARGDAGTTAGIIPQDPWSDFVDAYYGMAADDPTLGIIDLNRAFGDEAWVDGSDGYGLLHSDEVHLIDAGNERYATAIMRAITDGA